MMLPAALSILTTTVPEGRDRHTAPGAILATGGMLLLVYALVQVPTVGWGAARTLGELIGAFALLGSFVVNERRHRNPIAPLSIFRINGLGFADATQLIAFVGFLAMFFFLTLYMQGVLDYSPIQTGAAYLPLGFAIGISAGIASQLLARTGTRPVIVAGSLIAAGGMYWLSRIPLDGSYLTDLLPGLLILSIGLGPVFVGVTTAANAGVPRDQAGLAASLLNASQQLGGAARPGHLLRPGHEPHPRPPGRPHPRGPGAHLGLPARAHGREHLPPRRFSRRGFGSTAPTPAPSRTSADG